MERERMERAIAAAWMVAAYHRQKKLKPIGEILASSRRAMGATSPQQSRAELAGAIAVLSAQTGIPLRRLPSPAPA